MIRAAKLEDKSRLIDLCRFWHEEGALDQIGLNFNPITASFLLDASLSQEATFVSVQDDKVVGLISGLAYPWLGNHLEYVMQEMIWWIAPEYRSGYEGSKLIGKLEDRTRDLGLPGIVLNSMSVSRDSVDRFLERQGYRLLQKIFYKEL